jgi:hypothetical protein
MTETRLPQRPPASKDPADKGPICRLAGPERRSTPSAPRDWVLLHYLWPTDTTASNDRVRRTWINSTRDNPCRGTAAVRLMRANTPFSPGGNPKELPSYSRRRNALKHVHVQLEEMKQKLKSARKVCNTSLMDITIQQSSSFYGPETTAIEHTGSGAYRHEPAANSDFEPPLSPSRPSSRQSEGSHLLSGRHAGTQLRTYYYYIGQALFLFNASSRCPQPWPVV